MNTDDIVGLKARVLDGYRIGVEEALALAEARDKETLYASANAIREHYCGNRFHLCSITNAKSGKCSENCRWCSQSAWHKSQIDIYPMVEEQRALAEAKSSAEHGVHRHALVTSGKRVRGEELEGFLDIFRKLRGQSQIEFCASMGLLGRAELQRLKEAGVTRYHCNLETAPSYFPKVCTTHGIEEKIQTIQDARAVGLEVCSGGIIGMGESMAQRIELALLLRQLGILSIPINVLNPIEGTALAKSPLLSQDEVLTTFALFRFINPKAYLRFAGGRLLIRQYQAQALAAGINASIVGDMLTTLGVGIDEDLRDFSRAGFSFKAGQ